MQNTHNVLDLVASWIPLRIQSPKKILSTKLHFCISLNPPYLEDQKLVGKFQMLSYAENLAKGLFVPEMDKMAQLAAIHFCMDFIQCPNPAEELPRQVANYVPIQNPKENESSVELWVEKIEPLIEKYHSKARPVLLKEYIKIIEQDLEFGGHLFSCKVRKNNSQFRKCSIRDPYGIPQTAIISVSLEGLIILEEETRQPLLELDYIELTNWGCSKTVFVMSMGEIHALNKFYFELNQAPMLVWLMNGYANYRVNQPIEESSIETTYKFIHDKGHRLPSTFSYYYG